MTGDWRGVGGEGEKSYTSFVTFIHRAVRQRLPRRPHYILATYERTTNCITAVTIRLNRATATNIFTPPLLTLFSRKGS